MNARIRTEASLTPQESAEAEVDGFRQELGPFVVAAENTRMPMIFTNALEVGNPIVFANNAFLKLTGYALDEVLAQPFDFLMNRSSNPRTTDWFDPGSKLMREGTIEAECFTKSGHGFFAGIYTSPVADRSGRVQQYFSSFHDVTPHVNFANKLHRDLDILFRQAPAFMATTAGSDHRFTLANLSFLTLVKNADVVDRTVAEILPEFRKQGILEILDSVFMTGDAYLGNAVSISLGANSGDDGEQRYIDLICQPLRGLSGEITGLFLQGHDVTAHQVALDDQRALENQLIHYSRLSAMGTMAATLAHELHQPLASISNYASAGARLLRDDQELDAGQLRTAISGIVEGSARAREIIRQLKHLIARGAPQSQVIDLDLAVREAIQLARTGACEDTVIDQTSGSVVLVSADRVQIQQVVINLVRNACEAVSRSEVQKIRVEIDVEGEDAVVSVQDTGPGIPKDRVKALFQWGETSKPEGMGIGLAIARSIAEGHGGRIWLDKNSSEGARISFSLPRVMTTSPA